MLFRKPFLRALRPWLNHKNNDFDKEGYQKSNFEDIWFCKHSASNFGRFWERFWDDFGRIFGPEKELKAICFSTNSVQVRPWSARPT